MSIRQYLWCMKNVSCLTTGLIFFSSVNHYYFSPFLDLLVSLNNFEVLPRSWNCFFMVNFQYSVLKCFHKFFSYDKISNKQKVLFFFILFKCFRSDVETVELASLARQLMKERCDEWVQQLSGEKCKEVLAAILLLLADWYGTGQRVGNNAQTQLLELTKKSLKCQGHQVIHF
jgi:hypothetical protein